MSYTAQEFLAHISQNSHNAALMSRLGMLQLPDCWLVAGCLFQTVWNLQSGQVPTAHISDYDVFYFDAGDLSKAAEDAVNARVQQAFADLPITIEVKNQARVHTWYKDYFHEPYSALSDSKESLTRFLIACTCVGIRIPPDRLPNHHDVLAVHGFDDMYQGILRPNWQHRDELFSAKASSYQKRWQHLVVA